MSAAAPWRSTVAGIEIAVRLTPRAATDRVDGVADRGGRQVIEARVRAVPEDGKANSALEALIAQWLAVPKKSVSVTGGARSRQKTLSVSGDAAALALVIVQALESAEGA